MEKTTTGALCQIEIQVENLEKSLNFYQKIFGWTKVEAEISNYTLLDTGLNNDYGISLISVARQETKPKKHITLYFNSSQPELAYEQVENYGGKKRAGPIKIPGYGLTYLIEDPDGYRFGLFKAYE